MTVSIASIVLVPVFNAVIASIDASDRNTGMAQVETVLQNAADRINRAPKRCDYTIYVQAAAQAEGWAPAQASVTHQHYAPATTPATFGSWESGACDGPQAADLLVQLITITVTEPSSGVVRVLQVVKSDV